MSPIPEDVQKLACQLDRYRLTPPTGLFAPPRAVTLGSNPGVTFFSKLLL
jgi:hypothetical protein